MVKVQFNRSVKYKRKRYPAHTPFEVTNADAEELVKEGAVIIDDKLEKSKQKETKKDTNKK